MKRHPILAIAGLEVRRHTKAQKSGAGLVALPVLLILVALVVAKGIGFIGAAPALYKTHVYDHSLDDLIALDDHMIQVSESEANLYVHRLHRIGFYYYDDVGAAAAESLRTSILEFNRALLSKESSAVRHPVLVRSEFYHIPEDVAGVTSQTDLAEGLEKATDLSTSSDKKKSVNEQQVLDEIDKSIAAAEEKSTSPETPRLSEHNDDESSSDASIDGLQRSTDDFETINKDLETGLGDKIKEQVVGVGETTTNIEGDWVPASEMPTNLSLTYLARSLLIVMVVTFFSLMFAESVVGEKVNKRGTLLKIAPVKPWHYVLGKSLPWFAICFVFAIALGLFFSLDLFPFLVLTSLSFLVIVIYLSLGFMVASFCSSYKSLSFLGVFVISLYSMYLLIPAMVMEVLPVGDASPLSGITLALGNRLPSIESFLFMFFAHGAFALALVVLNMAIVQGEDYFERQNPRRRLSHAISRMLKSPYDLIWITGLFVPVAYLVEVFSLLFFASLKTPSLLIITLAVAAIVEEIFRNYPLAIAKEKKKLKWTPLRGAGFAALCALGFFIVEKGLLMIMIKPLLESHPGIVAVGLFVPLLIHVGLSVLYSLGLSYLKRSRPRAILALIILIHFIINVTILRVTLG